MSTPELRAVQSLDAEFLFEVYSSTRAAEMAMLTEWTDEQRHEFLAMQHHAQSTDFTNRFPDADYDLIVVSGRRSGRLWVDRAANEIRILDITVLPEFQRAGVGTALLRDLQAEAAAAGIPLRDSVFNANAEAKALYLRLGFVEVNDSGTYTALEWTTDRHPHPFA